MLRLVNPVLRDAEAVLQLRRVHHLCAMLKGFITTQGQTVASSAHFPAAPVPQTPFTHVRDAKKGSIGWQMGLTVWGLAWSAIQTATLVGVQDNISVSKQNKGSTSSTEAQNKPL